MGIWHWDLLWETVKKFHILLKSGALLTSEKSEDLTHAVAETLNRYQI